MPARSALVLSSVKRAFADGTRVATFAVRSSLVGSGRSQPDPILKDRAALAALVDAGLTLDESHSSSNRWPGHLDG